MTASSPSSILLLCIIGMTLQHGCAMPLLDQDQETRPDRATPPDQATPPGHVRTKRCSCSSWDDKECIYFCHLDIIWVNTPSKLVQYGLGSSRRRRSAGRCDCRDPADGSCRDFCRQSRQETSGDMKPTLEPGNTSSSKLLAAFRSVVESNMAVAGSLQPSKTLKSRTGG